MTTVQEAIPTTSVGLSTRRRVARRVLRNPLAVIGLVVVLTAVVAALPGIRASGPVGVWRDWLGTLSRVDLCPDSVPGSAHLFSIHNVFASMGLMLPSFIPLAIVATLALWWYRSRVASDAVLPLLLLMKRGGQGAGQRVQAAMD